MTNFLIAIPQIPLEEGNGTGSRPISATGFSSENVASGARSQHYRSASPTTLSRWSWSATAQIQPDFFGVCRADLLASWEPTSWTVEGASVSNFAATESFSGVFSLTSLKGPRAEDFVRSVNFQAPWQYWRVSFSTQSACYHELSKIYLCDSLDFGREPTLEPMGIDFKHPGASQREALQRFSITWRGISATKKQEMIERIATYIDSAPVILFDPADYAIHGLGALHCQVTDYKAVQESPNNYTIQMQVEELI